MSRIIAELAVQADTRELERAAKLFDEFSDAVKKGGKDAGKAYEDSLGAIDKLILKSNQLKKAQLDEKDIDEAKKYTKAIVEIDKQIAKVTGRLVQQKTATNELARGERAQAGILAQLLDREARLVRLRLRTNDTKRLDAFNRELANTRKKIDDINKASRPKGGDGGNGMAALLGSLSGGVSGVAGSLGGLAGGPIGAAVAGLAVDLGGALISTSKNALNAAAEMEGLKTQIEAFAGARVGTEIFREIEKFALENPVANLQESLRGTAMLLQEGFSAKESVDIVKQLTDVTKGNTDKFKDLSEADAKAKFGISESDLKIAEAVNKRLIDIEKKAQQDRAKLREAGEQLGFADKIFNFGKPEEVKKAAKTLADIEAEEAARRAHLIQKREEDELSKSEAYELKRLILKKKSSQELSDAERKALKDLNNEQGEPTKSIWTV